MKSKIITLVVLIIIIVLAIFFVNKRQPDNAVTIGAVLAQTGSAASYGEWTKNGIEIAVDQINNEGGIDGKKVKVIYGDSQGVAKEAVSAYKLLSENKNMKSVITMMSAVAMAVKPLAQEDNIVQMEVSATVSGYSTPNDLSYRVGVTSYQLAKEVASVSYNKFNSKNIALLYINNEYGKGMRDKVKEYYKGNILVEESFDQGGSDFRTSVLKVKQQEGQIEQIIMIGHLKESGILVKQLREGGVRTKILADLYTVKGPDFLSTAGSYSGGVVFVDSKYDANQNNTAKVFNEEYKKRFGKESTYYSAQAYDSLMSVALANKGCDNNQCVKTKLDNLDFEGASGKIKFDQNGDVEKELVLKVIKDGNYVDYK